MTASPVDDTSYIDACLAAGERGPKYNPWPCPPARMTCRWCEHTDHGVQCTQNAAACKCDGSYSSRDDSWRPTRYMSPLNPSQFMHVNGVDGWVARIACGQAQHRRGPQYVRKLITGELM